MTHSNPTGADKKLDDPAFNPLCGHWGDELKYLCE
jgi:hypothetical protein